MLLLTNVQMKQPYIRGIVLRQRILYEAIGDILRGQEDRGHSYGVLRDCVVALRRHSERTRNR